MADFEPTESQREAIEHRGSAVLVSAGAGSGKTKVLTERLMSYVCDSENPADIDSFLIITYTKAAAAELRGRISAELSKRLSSDPTNRRLRRQNSLCRRAQISTIHGFCSRLLKENCHRLGLTPDFRVADEQRAAEMRAAALDRVLEKRYAEADDHPGFILLADTVGAGRDDSRLAELVLNLHSKMQCHARPEKWARSQCELLNFSGDDIAETPWGKELIDWALETLDYYAADYDELMRDMSEYEKISKAYMPAFSDDAEKMRELRRRIAMGWDEAVSVFPVSFTKLGSLRDSPDAGLSERLKAHRGSFKKDIGKMQSLFSADSDTMLRELRSTAPAMEALLSLTLDFDREYAKDKKERSLLDYSDLEHMAAELLTDENDEPSEFARELSKRYTEIMVDEYQDVSRVQDAIFSAVSDGGRNLFFVGDIKQAIYRFRLADPEIFNEKYRSYAPAGTAGKGEACRILLRENFRSRREIIDCVNSVFGLCMSRGTGDVDYDEAAALRFGAEYFGGTVTKPELLLLSLPEKSGEDNPDKTVLEAEMVAERIRELIERGTTVGAKGEERPLEYGDIAILMRASKSSGPVFRRVLTEHGIPVGSVQGGGYFSTIEVSAVLSMLDIMDNPHKDIPLIAVLRSPAFGFTPDELSDIRAEENNCDFYSALEKHAEKNRKSRAFLDCLNALRSDAVDMSAASITWEVIERLNLPALCSAMSDGRLRCANLMELVELAEKFESGGYRGLHRYVLWLRALEKRGEEPSAGGSFASAVRIMTEHKSKGLEFPIVFLCDTARNFSKNDFKQSVLVHPELGLGPKLIDTARRVQYPTIARRAVEKRINKENASEEMRILYVAMTRAKERLIITAALREPEKAVDDARAYVSKPMSPEILRAGTSPIKWLIYAYLADEGRNMTLEIRSPGEKMEPEAGGEPPCPADPETLKELERRLSFVYPHSAAVELPSKITATELKGREERDDENETLVKPASYTFRMPELSGAERPLTAAERGIATHLVLQYMDISKAATREGIENEVRRLCLERFISEREADAVSISSVEKLFSSELGKRILACPEPIREFRFSILTDASALYEGAGGEDILLQGVVDCCIEENGELVIIDYKTDNVSSADEISSRTEIYRGQLMAYAEAMRRIFGKNVKECVLYFLKPGIETRLNVE